MSESLVSSRICLRQPETAARACSRRGSKSRGRWSFGSGNWSPLTFWRATTGQLSTGFPCCKGPPAAPMGGPRRRHRAPLSIGALAGLRPGSSSQLAGNGHLAPISGFQNAQTRPKCSQNATPVNPRGLNNRDPLHPLFVISHRWCGWTQGRSRPLFFFPAVLRAQCFVLPAAYATSLQAQRLHLFFTEYLVSLYQYLHLPVSFLFMIISN